MVAWFMSVSLNWWPHLFNWIMLSYAIVFTYIIRFGLISLYNVHKIDLKRTFPFGKDVHNVIF